MHMIAAIAYMGGHDLKHDKVKTLVFACLTGNAVSQKFGEKGVVKLEKGIPLIGVSSEEPLIL